LDEFQGERKALVVEMFLANEMEGNKNVKA
jgi:hypothetical protein